MISARAPFGDAIPLIDGGAFDWVAKLAANRKLVFIASALGLQLAAHVFRLAKTSHDPGPRASLQYTLRKSE